MKKERLRDYIFVDEELLTRFAMQARDAFGHSTRTETEASIGLTGPSVKFKKVKESAPMTIHDKANILEAYLYAKKELLETRPIEIPAIPEPNPPRFVSETMLATKVILPVSSSSALKGLTHAALWISDPDPSVYSNEPYVWRGSFLYLSEFHWDRERNHHISGVSALQLLVNILGGKEFWGSIGYETEPFGRGRDLHPIDKLKDLGAIVIGQRRIRSLYRIRYFTNEQAYKFHDEKRRVNDIFGYPLYILAED